MKKHYIGIIALGLSLSASSAENNSAYHGVGIASYYDDAFDGCITANGETFRQREMTCAHLWLPLGTMVKVTNLKNHKSVILRVNDRGPYVDGRMIDLSKSAAQILGFTEDGLAAVRIEALSITNFLALRAEEFNAGLKMGYGRSNYNAIENLSISNNTMIIPGHGRVKVAKFRLTQMDPPTSRIQCKDTFNYLVFIGIFYRPEKASAFHEERKPNIPDAEPLRFFKEHRAVAWIAP